jgi:hypothetical protein
MMKKEMYSVSVLVGNKPVSTIDVLALTKEQAMAFASEGVKLKAKKTYNGSDSDISK